MQLKFSPRTQFPDRGPCIQLYGDWVTVRVWKEVSLIMGDNFIDSPIYAARRKANAFFQGGSHDARGKWILIECWADEDECSDFLAILNYVVHGALEQNKTHIRILDNGLGTDQIKESCLVIAAETNCRLEHDFSDALAVFAPRDNITHYEILRALKQHGLTHKRHLDRWEEEESVDSN